MSWDGREIHRIKALVLDHGSKMSNSKNKAYARAVRITVYTPFWSGNSMCRNVIVREADLYAPIAEFIQTETNPYSGAIKDSQGGIHECFAIADVFDISPRMTDDALLAEGKRRQDKREVRELKASIMFYWNARQLKFLPPSVSLVNPTPAPLPVEYLVYGFSRLALLPWYEGQTVICSSAIDGSTAELAGGQIRVDGVALPEKGAVS